MSYTGSCFCGKVKFEIKGKMTGLINCHCKDCQKIHGNYNPMMIVNEEQIKINNKDNLSWFESSKTAKRGFCKTCGSSIFKSRRDDTVKYLISAGSFDDSSNFKTIKNIWLESKGNYYIVPDEANN